MHKAKNCVINCIDFRMQMAYADFVKTHGMLGESDLISLAGCSRDLAKPLETWHKDSLLRQIDLSVKLHDPETIIFLDHQDCGGYAQDGTITQGLTAEEDMSEHRKWGRKARVVLQEIYPNKNIKNYFFHLDGKVEEI